MRKNSAIQLGIGVFLLWQTGWGLEANDRTPADATDRARAAKVYRQLALRFEANQGQADAPVKFLCRGRDYTLFLTSNEAVLAFKRCFRHRLLFARA
jgi:hypothetical protein